MLQSMYYLKWSLFLDLGQTSTRKKSDGLLFNIRSVLSYFYVGTGGLDIGLICSAQGIPGGENWEKTFTWHSPLVCKAILKVVDEKFGML